MSEVIASLPIIGSGGEPFTLTLSSYYYNPNIRSLAVAAGWDQSAPLIVSITAATGGYINIPTAAQASFPGGLTLRVASTANVYGNTIGYGNPRGGTAITVKQPITIDNLGSIIGGGGPGGPGGSASASGNSASGGDGGRGAGASSSGYVAPTAGSAGQSKSGPGSPPAWELHGGTGGYGGIEGNAGSPGTAGTGYGDGFVGAPGNPGFPPGYAVDGDSYVTWINTGTRIGGLTG